MSSKEIIEYYADTFDSEVRSDLMMAIGLVDGEKIAIDCGCGAGSDIAYLRKEGFIVHAFDVEDEAIKICAKRFSDDAKVHLSQESFFSFDYPKSSLLVADASLFFCSQTEFDFAWHQIYNSLSIGGIFCGSFLGPKDTMASPDFNRAAFWPNIMVFNESELKLKLADYRVVQFKEHNVHGTTPSGDVHNWHIYSVVAQKV